MQQLTSKQFKMLMTALTGNHTVNVKDYIFTIENRFSVIYEFDQYYKGVKTVLHVGTIDECLDAAKDYIMMTFNIND